MTTVPADRLAEGSYLLTLSGERPGSQAEDISQSLFSVARK
jgi:hypothetical protein